MTRSKKSKAARDAWPVTGSDLDLPTTGATPAVSFSDVSETSKKSRRKNRNHRDVTSISLSEELSALNISSMPSSGRLPLLILSIGNPGAAYRQTPHSAGHIILSALRSSSLPSNWTLKSSTSFMNVSGPWITKEIASFANSLGPTVGKLPVAILHDSLEHAPGEVKLLSMTKSAAGHNGIKSIKQNLPGLEQKLKKSGVELVIRRLAIGIGRPVSRDATEVSNWVLRKMNNNEVDKMEGQAGKVVGLLEEWMESEEEEDG